jgi:crossover junction endodeoxyribonuclease RuvC
MKIIGIDPGLINTGWGIVDLSGQCCYIAHGVIKTKSTNDLPNRLAHIHRELTSVIHEHQPEHASVEITFVNNNPQSTLKLGMARGVILSVPALLGLQVFEYSANYVKKNVVGFGHADKKQVTAILMMLLKGCPPVDKDAADALALAVCHSNHAHWDNTLRQTILG